MKIERARQHLAELASDEELPRSTRDALRRCADAGDRIDDNDIRELAGLALDAWRGRTAPAVVERFAARIMGVDLRTA